MADLGLPFAPEAFPVEFLALGGLGPGRAAARDGERLRAAAARQGARARTRRRSRASRSSSTTPTRKGLPLLDLERPARAAHVPGLRRRQAGARGHRRAVARRPSACCCARWSGWRPAAGRSSSASRSSTSPTCCALAPDGRGVVSCVELAAVQDKPALWSTALMWLVAELFEALPEAGDLPQAEARRLPRRGAPAVRRRDRRVPRRARAHRAADPLQGRRRLLRHPAADRPLRGGARPARPARSSTRCARSRPADAKKLRATVSTYPRSDLYDVETLLTSVGIGEAAVTLLSEKGVPTPVVHTRMVAPASRMDPADDVDGRREGVAAVGEVRRAGRRAERARDPRRAARAAAEQEATAGEPALDGADGARAGAAQARRAAPGAGARRRRAPTRSATSCARARARRCSARSRAASSGCCASGSSAASVDRHAGIGPARRVGRRSGGCGNAAQPAPAKLVEPARPDAEVGDREQRGRRRRPRG